MQPCDELELDLQSVDKTEKVTVEQIPSDAMVEVSNKSEDAEEFMMEAKVVEQMMGSIVRQAVEGGSNLLQTWLQRKTGN